MRTESASRTRKPRIAWLLPSTEAARLGLVADPVPGAGKVLSADLLRIWSEDLVHVAPVDGDPIGADAAEAEWDGAVVGAQVETASLSRPGPEPIAPSPPVIELAELADLESRDSFLVRVFAHQRLRDLCSGGFEIADLVAYNVSERFLLLAHDPKQHRMLGRLVSKPKHVPPDQLQADVTSIVRRALAKKVTRRKHVYALERIAELFGDRLAAREDAHLQETLAAFRNGEIPLLAPLVLLRHLGRAHGISSLRGQTYLEPSPSEMRLRFHP